MPAPRGVDRGRTFSTGQLMRLVVLVAANLALFQGVWWLIVFPPIAMIVISLNLVLQAAWVRRRGLTRPEFVAALVGLLAAVATAGYLATFQMRPQMAGQLLSVLPDVIEDLVARVHSTVSSRLGIRIQLEYDLLIGLGVLAMVLAGVLTRRFLPRGGRAGGTDRNPSP